MTPGSLSTPPSSEGFSTCSAFVPENRTLFLSEPFMSSESEPSLNSIDSLSKGVDSPESMASLTIHVPRRSRRSHGIPESGLVRTETSAEPQRNESGWRTDADKIPRDKFRAHDFLPLAVAIRLNVVRRDAHRPELGERSDSLKLSEIAHSHITAPIDRLTWKTTVHSKTTSMKAVKRE